MKALLQDAENYSLGLLMPTGDDPIDSTHTIVYTVHTQLPKTILILHAGQDS